MLKFMQYLRRNTCIMLFKACLLAGLFTACSSGKPLEIQTLSGYAIGTSYSVKLVSSLTEAQRLQIGIEGVLADVNTRMSTYLPKSDLSLFAVLPIGEWQSVSPRTVQVVQRALEVAQQSDGYFDPTLAELVDLWGFGPTPRQDQRPSDEAIKEANSRVGFEAILVDEKTSALSKSAERTLDLSAIAKGYAVDLIADYLLEKGIDNFLVEVGGEMRLNGLKPGGESWRVAIEDPASIARSVHVILEVTDLAIATSGDYRNYFEIDGQRYSHTLNPKTGYPVDHDLTSVTVIASTAMDADAWATAFSAMGTAKAMRIANQENIAAYFIVRGAEGFEYTASDAFIDQFGQQLAVLNSNN